MLDLVIEGEGSNDLVECNHRMMKRNLLDDSDDDDLMEIIALLDEMSVE